MTHKLDIGAQTMDRYAMDAQAEFGQDAWAVERKSSIGAWVRYTDVRATIEAQSAQIATLQAEVERLREALEPFAHAWETALRQAGDGPCALRTTGPLGALAAYYINGAHFLRARIVARAEAAEARKGEAG